jgi:hypothetical protein
MTQEVKKRNSWKIVAIALLVIVIIMGAIIGILWMRQEMQSEYAKVKVFSDDSALGTFDGYSYLFLYKYSYHHTFDPQKPIEIQVRGLSETLPPNSRKNIRYFRYPSRCI